MHAAQRSGCASAYTCFCMAARLHMRTAAPASARAHRGAAVTAVPACVRGGQDSHAQPCFPALPAWPGTWWYRSAAGAEGCSSPEQLATAPCVPSRCAMGVCSCHAAACGCDTALSHVWAPKHPGSGEAAGRSLAGGWWGRGVAGHGLLGGDGITPGLPLPAPRSGDISTPYLYCVFPTSGLLMTPTGTGELVAVMRREESSNSLVGTAGASTCVKGGVGGLMMKA